MTPRDDSPDSKHAPASAGLAGAGGGTLLALLSTTLPDGHAAKLWLIYLAPSSAVILSAVWLWIQRKIASHFREREVRDLFARAKTTLQQALDNPKTTDEHRQRLRTQLEELEMLDVTRVVDQIRSLKMLSSADPAPASGADTNANIHASTSGKQS